MALEIKPREQCRWDAAALGEIMLRLDPGDGRIRTTRQFKVWEGGGEYNVVRGLRRCFGLRTTVVTAIVDNEIGRLLEDLMLQGGVDLSHVQWAPVRRHRPRGAGRTELHREGLRRASRRWAARTAAYSAASQLKPGDVDWKQLFERGGRALVPLRRHLRRALGHHGRPDDRGHAGRAREAGTIVSLRPQLPRLAVEVAGRRRHGRRGQSARSRRSWT